MPSFDPRAVANALVAMNGGPIDPLRTQRLLFLADGWCQAVMGAPLIATRFAAADCGPVLVDLHGKTPQASDGLWRDRTGAPLVADLSHAERALLERVWRKYGHQPSFALGRMLAQPGSPWSNAYFGTGREALLPRTGVKAWFVRLALAGRQTAAC